MLNTMLVLKATIMKRWRLERMKDQDPAVNYRCEIDTAVLAEKQESAHVNGRWEHFKSTVVAELHITLGHKTSTKTGGEERNKLKSTFRRRLQIRSH